MAGLWCRLAPAAPIRPLACELPHAADSAVRRGKKKKKKERKEERKEESKRERKKERKKGRKKENDVRRVGREIKRNILCEPSETFLK